MQQTSVQFLVITCNFLKIYSCGPKCIFIKYDLSIVCLNCIYDYAIN